MQIRGKSLHGHEWSQKYNLGVPKLSFRNNSRSSDSKTARTEASRAFLVEEEEKAKEEDTTSRSRNFRSAVKGFLKMRFMEGETVRALCMMNAISHCTVHAPKRRNLCKLTGHPPFITFSSSAGFWISPIHAASPTSFIS